MTGVDLEINPQAGRRIFGIAERLLVEADLAGEFPTPLNRVAEIAGIAEVISMNDLPDDLVIKKPRAWRRILGAYIFRSKTAFVDLDQTVGRARFIQAHETGHKIIPWHEDSFYLDDEGRLFRDTEERFELEANLAAAHLIFQGRRFFDRALDHERSINTPVAIAGDFGASIHATIRYYVEHHPDPVAVVIAGRYRRADWTVPVWASVESPSFRRRYGRLIECLPGGTINVAASEDAVAQLARGAFTSSSPQSRRIDLVNLRGESRKFKAEAFFNQRCLFLMVSPHALLRQGRRVELATG